MSLLRRVEEEDFVKQKRRVVLFHLLQNMYRTGFSCVAAPKACSLEDDAFIAGFRGRIHIKAMQLLVL